MAIDISGEEHLFGVIPSRTEDDPCGDIPDEKRPTWADLIFWLNNNDVHVYMIKIVGCDVYSSEENPESDNGLNGWQGVRDKNTTLRIPLGGTPGRPAVPILQALANTQNWTYTALYASMLSNGETDEQGSVAAIIVRKIN